MNPYSILGISSDSSKDDIKKAYRKLAMKYHPDKGGDPKKFQEINNAYEELTSEKKNDMGHGFPFGFGQSSGASGPDIFETFFGHTRQQHRQQQKKTIKKQIKISMEEAYNGVKKTLNIKNEHDCDCRVKCVKCKGTGFVTVQIKQSVGHGYLVQTVRSHCDECRDGYKPNSSKCDKCNNTGKTHVEKKIEINIDKGVETGKSYLRDNVIDDAVLMFIIFIDLEPNFEIVQNNIIFRQKIAFVDTIFGTTLELKHPSGQTINVNTRGFSNILTESNPHIIHGKGMTPKHNYVVHFKIDYPRIKTDNNLKDSIRSKFNELLN